MSLGRDVLVNAALLVVFTAVELVADDYSPELQPYDIFENLSSKYKDYELLWWLANTYSKKKEIVGPDDEKIRSTVLLESLFSGDWRDMQTPAASEQSLLMYWIRVWTFGSRLTEQYDDIVPHIMALLLTSSDLEHASELLRFLPVTAWALYVRARYHLMTGVFADAAEFFTRAAPELSSNSIVGQQDLYNHLLQVEDFKSFNDGSARFFQHVLGLFEKVQAMSYVAHFAGIALRSTTDDDVQDSNLKSDILARLFAAYISISRFEEAFAALTEYTDAALRRAALRSLIKSLLSADQVPLLMSLPFPVDLAHEADVYLDCLCYRSSTTGPSPRSMDSLPVIPMPAHKILYAFRTRRSDFRGAALVLYAHIQHLKAVQRSRSVNETDDELKESYLGCMNSLLLVGEGMRWLLMRHPPDTAPTMSMMGDDRSRNSTRDGKAKRSRKVVTLEDVRHEWQAELDRSADVEAGRYPLDMDQLTFECDMDAMGAPGVMPGAFGPDLTDSQAGLMELDVSAS